MAREAVRNIRETAQLGPPGVVQCVVRPHPSSPFLQGICLDDLFPAADWSGITGPSTSYSATAAVWTSTENCKGCIWRLAIAVHISMDSGRRRRGSWPDPYDCCRIGDTEMMPAYPAARATIRSISALEATRTDNIPHIQRHPGSVPWFTS